MTDQSIHPRVEARSEKVNTCGNTSTAKRLQRQLAGIEKHLKEHPHDVLSQARISTIKTLMAAA